MFKTILILVYVMLLSGCAPRMSQAIINDIKRIDGYARYTKPQDNPTHYNFDLTTEKLNDDGSEYRIFFRDKNELVRIKYLKVQETANVTINFYYEKGDLILASYEEAIDEKSYRIYRKNNRTIYICCKDDKPDTNLVKMGETYYKDYLILEM